MAGQVKADWSANLIGYSFKSDAPGCSITTSVGIYLNNRAHTAEPRQRLIELLAEAEAQLPIVSAMMSSRNR
jgi:hypothetical protein